MEHDLRCSGHRLAVADGDWGEGESEADAQINEWETVDAQTVEWETVSDLEEMEHPKRVICYHMPLAAASSPWPSCGPIIKSNA